MLDSQKKKKTKLDCPDGFQHLRCNKEISLKMFSTWSSRGQEVSFWSWSGFPEYNDGAIEYSRALTMVGNVKLLLLGTVSKDDAICVVQIESLNKRRCSSFITSFMKLSLFKKNPKKQIDECICSHFKCSNINWRFTPYLSKPGDQSNTKVLTLQPFCQLCSSQQNATCTAGVLQ